MTDNTILNYISQIPLSSLTGTENIDGSISIEIETVRLAIENVLNDFNYAYEVLRDGDKLIIQPLLDNFTPIILSNTGDPL